MDTLETKKTVSKKPLKFVHVSVSSCQFVLTVFRNVMCCIHILTLLSSSLQNIFFTWKDSTNRSYFYAWREFSDWYNQQQFESSVVSPTINRFCRSNC